MMLRVARWVALLSAMPLLASVAPPSGWVPARWNGTNPQTLDLLFRQAHQLPAAQFLHA